MYGWKWPAVCLAIVVVGWAALEHWGGKPNISNDTAKQREDLRQRIVRHYALEENQHHPDSLPAGMRPSDLIIQRELTYLEPDCRGYLLVYRLEDGRLWHWEVWTDPRGYAVLWDAGSPTISAASVGADQIPNEPEMVRCW